MDARENFLSCLSMNEHERIPTFIFDTSFGCSILGCNVSDLYRDGFDAELSAKSISAGRRFLGHDGMVGATSCGDTRVFGAEIELRDDRPSMITRPAFSDPSQLYKQSPYQMDDTVDELAHSNSLLRGIEKDAFIAGYVPSPFLLCAVLRGLEPLLMDLVMDKTYVEDLLEFSKKIEMTMNERICSEGSCDAILIPGAYDNVDLIGLDALERFCIPNLVEMRERVSSFGLPTIFHPHGALTTGPGVKALELFMDTGFDCIYYGEDVDHRKFRELTKGRCSMMGGIDTASTIYLGPDDRVIRDTEDVLKQTDGADYIFTCSCSVDAYLDRKRLKLMIDTVREH